MSSWQVQDAKARFSELLDATARKGPQVLTRRGVEVAVVVPIEDWRRLQVAARPSLKQVLLGAAARFDLELPDRGHRRRRAPEPG